MFVLCFMIAFLFASFFASRLVVASLFASFFVFSHGVADFSSLRLSGHSCGSAVLEPLSLIKIRYVGLAAWARV